jgi:hypothetical protein
MITPVGGNVTRESLTGFTSGLRTDPAPSLGPTDGDTQAPNRAEHFQGRTHRAGLDTSQLRTRQ